MDIYDDSDSLTLRIGFFSRAAVGLVVWTLERPFLLFGGAVMGIGVLMVLRDWR